jgi:hypothetical protein
MRRAADAARMREGVKRIARKGAQRTEDYERNTRPRKAYAYSGARP